MKTGRWRLMGLIVLAAYACGWLGWKTFSGYGDRHYYELGVHFDQFEWPNTTSAVRQRFPGERGVTLVGTPEEYYGLARKFPDRPWYLWQWWKGQETYPRIRRSAISGQITTIDAEEPARQVAVVAANARFMAACDPENGLPLALLAAMEAVKGVSRRLQWQDGVGYDVIDREAMGRAIELLHRAAAKDRITMYEGEMAAERLALLGKPETYAEGLVINRTLQLPSLAVQIALSTFAYHVIAEVERRSVLSPEQLARESPTLSAADTIMDMQTLGAKCLAEANHYSGIYPIVRSMNYTTEEGAKLLRAADRDEEAERILARGRKLIRPMLLADLMNNKSKRYSHTRLIENDAELIEEAERLLALRQENSARVPVPDPKKGDYARASFLLAVSIPGMMSTPWTTPPISFDDMQIISRYETWARQRIFLSVLAIFACLPLLFCLILYVLHVLTFRDGNAKWPPTQRAGLAAALCGLAAGGPGLLVCFIGNFRWALIEKYATWQFFWSCWGVMLAAWVLWSLVRRWHGKPLPGGCAETEDRPDAPRKRLVADWRRLVVPAGLILAGSFAYFGYAGGDKEDCNVFCILDNVMARGSWEWTAAFLLLALLAVGSLYMLIRRFVVMMQRRSWNVAMTPALRLLLMSWAGGILLWTASYCIIDYEERKWVARDTLLFPRATGAKTEFLDPLSRKLAEYHSKYTEQVLAEERQSVQ